MKYLLNSAVITSFGNFSYTKISKQDAYLWDNGEAISTIGYEETAIALSDILKREITVNRQIINMEVGDTALVFRLVYPKGTPRIDPKDKGAILSHVEAGNIELGFLIKLT